MSKILLLLSILFILSSIITTIFVFFPNAKITNYYDKKILKHIKVFSKNPKVNLKHLPITKTNVFTIYFDKAITEKLKGEYITIILKKGIVKKMIIDNKIEVNI